MYQYKQKDFNEHKNQTALIVFTLIFFIVAYVLVSNDEYKTLKAEQEFYSNGVPR